MNTSVSSSAWNAFGRLFWPVAIILALLLGLSWLMGYGGPWGGSMCKAPAAVAAPMPAPAPALAPPMPAPAPALAPPPAPVAAVAAPVVATPAPAAPVVVAPAPAPAPAAAPAGDAPPAAKLYFGLDKTGLPGTTNGTLADVVAYLKRNNGAKAIVSGFHDPSGNAEHNQWLAKTRAEMVSGALQGLGIAQDRIVLEKPAETTGTGTPREARRVEVSVRQ